MRSRFIKSLLSVGLVSTLSVYALADDSRSQFYILGGVSQSSVDSSDVIDAVSVFFGSKVEGYSASSTSGVIGLGYQLSDQWSVEWNYYLQANGSNEKTPNAEIKWSSNTIKLRELFELTNDKHAIGWHIGAGETKVKINAESNNSAISTNDTYSSILYGFDYQYSFNEHLKLNAELSILGLPMLDNSSQFFNVNLAYHF